MKIVVPVVIEMTPEQMSELANEYGIGDQKQPKEAEVREFCRGYMRELAQQSAAAEFWSATVR